MSAGAGIIGGSIVSGLMGSDAAGDAADAQAQAASDANATQLRMFEQSRKDMEPWRKAGESALGQINNLLTPGSEFQRNFSINDFYGANAPPDYAHLLDEGQRALERAGAARGTVGSGRMARELTRYAQDVASQEYQNAYNRFNNDRNTQFNRLASVANVGQTASSQLGSLGSQVGSNIAETQLQAGNARASGYMGQANAWNNAIGGGINSYLQYNALQKAGLGGGQSSNFFDLFGSGGGLA